MVGRVALGVRTIFSPINTLACPLGTAARGTKTRRDPSGHLDTHFARLLAVPFYSVTSCYGNQG